MHFDLQCTDVVSVEEATAVINASFSQYFAFDQLSLTHLGKQASTMTTLSTTISQSASSLWSSTTEATPVTQPSTSLTTSETTIPPTQSTPESTTSTTTRTTSTILSTTTTSTSTVTTSMKLKTTEQVSEMTEQPTPATTESDHGYKCPPHEEFTRINCTSGSFCEHGRVHLTNCPSGMYIDNRGSCFPILSELPSNNRPCVTKKYRCVHNAVSGTTCMDVKCCNNNNENNCSAELCDSCAELVRDNIASWCS